MVKLPVDLNITNRDEIYNFLVSRAGKPFRVDPASTNAPINKAWRCLQFSFKWLGPGVWGFTAEFEEVGGKWTI